MKKTTVAGVVFCVAAGLVWAGWDTTAGLRARHGLQSRLKPWSVVATLHDDRAGSFRMFLDPDDSFITPTLWGDRTWEPNETRWFVESVRPGDVIVDVGANVGYYTLLGSKLVGDEGRVYAFEPDPTAFALLQRNVRVNGLQNVVLEQKAVSNAPGSLRLYLADANKGDHRIYQPEGEQRPFVDVEAVTLDGYFEGREEAVDYVKVDTQGAEAVILEGMTGLIERSPSVVMAFEFSPRHLAGFGSDSRKVVVRLKDLQFAIFDFGMGSGGRLQRVTGRQLLKRFPANTPFFTNLLLVKGRPDLLETIRDLD